MRRPRPGSHPPVAATEHAEPAPRWSSRLTAGARDRRVGFPPLPQLARRWLPLGAGVLAAIFGSPRARAHHGQEFLVVQDASVPSLWSGSVFGGLEWSRDGSADEISQEPGFMVGLGSRFALGTTVGFTGSENDWQFESVSPFALYEITPSTSRVRVAVIAGYHFADNALGDSPAAPLSVVTPTTEAASAPSSAAPVPPPPPPPDPDPDPPCGPAYGPDAPPCPDAAPSHTGRHYRHAGHEPIPPATSPSPQRPPTTAKPSAAARRPSSAKSPTPAPPQYDGIHRHDEDHAFARLVVEADLTENDKLIVNLIGLWPESGRPAWGYAAGVRHGFSHAFAAGLEAIGDFGDANEHELIIGSYFSPTHQLSLKLGAGIGLTNASPDFSLRTGLVWRF